MPLRIVPGTPYEQGTTDVHLGEHARDGETVVEFTFGNVFSETNVPVTLSAAREIHVQLTRALIEAGVLLADLHMEDDER